MYWITYEHQFVNQTFMPEDRWKANIDWMAEHFLPYGYDMVSTDGWIEGATLLNPNGYVVSHNDSWMTNPLSVSGSVYGVINGAFNDSETTGWTFDGPALHGRNDDGGNRSLWTWLGDPHKETVSQTVALKGNGRYRVSAKAKTKNGMADAGVYAFMRIKGYNADDPNAVAEQQIASESWTVYTADVDVTNGSVLLEFSYDAETSGKRDAGLDLDDVTVEKVNPVLPSGNQVVNGDFEQGDTAGWSYGEGFNHGTNVDPEGDKSLWTWNEAPAVQSVTQSVYVPNGRYSVKATAKTKNGMIAGGASAAFLVKGYDAANPDAVTAKPVISESWTDYAMEVDVSSGALTLEFAVDAKGTVHNAGIDVDDVSVEAVPMGDWQGYPEERYPDGHTWKYWGDYIHGKGMKMGIYYNPMWISPEVVKHPDKYKVAGTDTPVADLVITAPQDLGNGKVMNGDRFDGGQGAERAPYWLNVDHPDAEKFLKGYVKFFKDQGASFLRVDFLSWYETGTDKGIGRLGTGHDRDDYEKALRWMSEACEENGIFLSLVMPHLKNHGEAERKYGDMVRIDEDVFHGGWEHISGRRQEWTDTWSQWANPFQGFTGFADISGRSSLISDGDFLRLNTFTGRWADNEKKTAISLFTLAGSPITIADQFDTIGDNSRFYQNTEMIELNKLGLTGKPLFYSKEHYKNNVSRDSERWVGQLPDGSWIVGLFNRSDVPKGQYIDFKQQLGLVNGGYVRDLWTHQDIGYRTLVSDMIDPHDSKVLRVYPKSAAKQYQAEAASYMGGAMFNNVNAGFSGFGYVDGLSSAGSKVVFAVSVPKAGEYPLGIRYANGTNGNASLSLSVKGLDNAMIAAPVQVGFDSLGDGNWDRWGMKSVSVNLAEGVNLITLERTGQDTGNVNLDYLDLKLGEAEVLNGDFEQGNDVGWTSETFGTTAWIGVDSNDAYQGQKKYIYLPNQGEAKISQTISGMKDGTYRLKAQVKLMPHMDPHLQTPGFAAEMRILEPGKEKKAVALLPKIIDDTPSDPTTGKYEANKFEYQEFALDADITSGEATIEFYMKSPSGDTSLQLDNVTIEKVGAPSETIIEAGIYNKSFDNGLTNWSSSNVVNTSVRTEDGNGYVHFEGAAPYDSDLWQFTTIPKNGTYTLKAKVRKTGGFSSAQLFVNSEGGTQSADIPAGTEWTPIEITNIGLQKDEAVKLGLHASGEPGSTLDLDDVELLAAGSQDNGTAASLGNLAGYETVENGKSVLFRFAGSPKVKLEFVRDGIAKVWMEPKGVFAKKSSFVVQEENAGVTPEVSDAGDYIKIRTPAMTVRAYKSPFRLAYFDPTDTKLLSQEVPSGGLRYNGGTGVFNYMALDPQEHFFGLGMDRDARSFDRRNKRVTMNNEMKGGYGGNTSDISGTFFTSTKGYGILFDNTYENVVFDMGSESQDSYSFSAPNGEMLYYFMTGEGEGSLQKVMQHYSELTGSAPLPPKWALGYIQSKFGYKSWDEVRSIADTFRTKGIPMDAIVLDAYWAKNNHYFDMTWSDSFANPNANMASLADQGVKIVPIVDPYVQVTANSFNEGDAKGYFVKDASGQTIIYDAWYGKSGLVDFTNPAAADWFTKQVKTLHDAGVKGWWIDLNEPERATDPLRHRFQAGSAAEITNVYALNEAKSFYEGQRSFTNERVWSLARSGFSGIQRYGTTVWSGDVDASWDAFTHNLQLGLSAAISGIPYFTNDTGGFYGKPSPELYARWMQAASFMPVFRAHNCECGDSTNSREPWVFSNVENIVTDAIKQRYQLLPYLYSAAKKTSEGNSPIMKPLVMDYANDANVYGIEDQWLFGSSMLVAPVHAEGAAERSVYLPAGVWYEWNGSGKYTGGQTITYAADLSKIPVFVKEGSIIPVREAQAYTDQSPAHQLNLKIYPATGGGTANFTLYEDDGTTYAYENGKAASTELSAARTTAGYTVNIGAMKGDYGGKVASRVWSSEVKIDSSTIKGISLVKRNGKNMSQAGSKAEAEAGTDVWYYDSAAGTLFFRTAEVSTADAQGIEIKVQDKLR